MTDSPGGQATSTALHLQSQATAFDEGIRGVIPIVVQRRKTRELGKYSFLATLIATRRRRGPCVSMVSTPGRRASTAGPGDFLADGVTRPTARRNANNRIQYPKCSERPQDASAPALSVILSKPARRKGNFSALE